MNAREEFNSGTISEQASGQKRVVTVTVDNKPVRVEEETYVVSEFKRIVGVDASKELDEIIHGELRPLRDDQKIHVKGGDVFISHARQGGSS